MTSVVVLFTFLLANTVKYPQIEKEGLGPKSIFSKDVLFEARVVPACWVALICSGVYGGLISFMSLYMEETGIRTGIAILDSGAAFFIAYAFGLTIIRPIAGVQMDRYGPARVMLFGFLGLITGLVILAQSQEIISFLLASLIAGMGMGVIMPTVITMVVNIVEPHRRGVANSTFFSAVDIGVGIGTILLGKLADMTSVRMMYFLLCVFNSNSFRLVFYICIKRLSPKTFYYP